MFIGRDMIENLLNQRFEGQQTQPQWCFLRVGALAFSVRTAMNEWMQCLLWEKTLVCFSCSCLAEHIIHNSEPRIPEHIIIKQTFHKSTTVSNTTETLDTRNKTSTYRTTIYLFRHEKKRRRNATGKKFEFEQRKLFYSFYSAQSLWTSVCLISIWINEF